MILTQLLFLFSWFAAVVIFFAIVQRPLFIIYNRKSLEQPLTAKDIFNIYRKGLPTDCIIASYYCAIPIIIGTLCFMFGWQKAFFIATVAYAALLSLATSLLVVADTALYKFWQYKIDCSVTAYLRSFKGAFASVSTSYIIIAFSTVLFVAAILFLLLYAVARATALLATWNGAAHWWTYIAMPFVAALSVGIFFLIIRGLGRRPNNPSMAFYCAVPFLNHSALNPIYNLIYSFSTKEDFSKQFQFFDKEESARETSEIFSTPLPPAEKLFTTDRPNILLIVWESLCAIHVGALGAKGNVTPNFDRLAEEGIFFSNCMSGSFRTDRGLVCTLSGYPAQPTSSIIRYTRKLPHLPGIPRTLKEYDYITTAVHGGDLEIFHKRDFYWAVGHDNLVEQKHFPADAPTGKWGVHDGYVFDWLYDDIQKKTEEGVRWFTTFQTLSSHETWQVPYNRIPDNEIANSFAYVDDAFGRFIDRLKKSPAWSNTLVIVLGDHGVNIMRSSDKSCSTNIPILMVGGCIAKPRKFEQIISQTDLAATLLAQLDIPHSDFIFSRDVLSPSYTYPCAYHAYHNGVIFKDGKGETDYDTMFDRCENPDPEHLHHIKAILQTLYTDIAAR